jgi:DNA mismatch repair protein MutS2
LVLIRWLGEGRGDALRHLGWTRLIARAGEHLHTDMARERVRDEITAIEALVEGRLRLRDEDGEVGGTSGCFGALNHAQIVEDWGPGVAAALGDLPSLRPETELEAAQARLDELRGIEALLALDAGLGDPGIEACLARLEDLDESLEVARGKELLSVVELIGVAELCRACARLIAVLAQAEPGDLSEAVARGLRARALDDADSGPPVGLCPQLLARIDRAIDRRGEEPQIASEASPGLAEARSELRGARQRLQAKAERLLRNPTIAESLRDRYWTEREGRIVFPVRSDRLGAVRSRGAIIHGSSSSGQTFYVEPAGLVEDNNALREAELAVAEEERKILRELSSAVAERAEVLAGMQQACIEVDLMIARLRFGEAFEHGVQIPELVEGQGEVQSEATIELRAARHPLMLLDGVEVVPNDIVLPRGHALIVSGPNAGGKTVALKTLGMFALMAAAGFALPCEGRPRLPVFSRVITDVGDDQSIIANLSTFSAHVGHVLEALRAAAEAGSSTLVLLDEVAVGTDPEQGAALAEAILVELVGAGATVVATTHYDRLKLLATAPPTSDKFHNAAVGFDLARMRPTFRLSLGVPGSSSAIAVARRLGLPEAVLTRAEELLGDEGVQIDELLRDIEAERQSLARTRERLEREQLRLRQRDREVRVRERRVLEGVRSRRAKAYAAAAEQLRALEVEIKRKRKQLRRVDPARVEELPTRAELAGEARSKLAEHRAEAEAERDAERAPDQRLDPRALALGDRVRVLSMKQEGEVVSLSGKPPKKVTVQLPTLRTTVKIEDLGPPLPSARRARVRPGKAEPLLDFQAALRAQAEAHFGDSPVAIKAGVDNTCDLRGQRYADAQEQVANFVAEALARDQDVILIRHGHGGGSLRKAVREVLSRLANVRRSRPGLPEEGGDAVTVAWLE